MIKIRVYTKEGYHGVELNHLRPRRYMCGYSFDSIMKYAKEELYWADVKEEDVSSFEIYCEKEHWCQYISREGE